MGGHRGGRGKKERKEGEEESHRGGRGKEESGRVAWKGVERGVSVIFFKFGSLYHSLFLYGCWIMNKGVIVFRGEEERKTDKEDEKRGRKTRRGCSLSLQIEVVSGSSNMCIYHKTSIPRLPTWC